MRVAYDVELVHYASHPVQFDRSMVYVQPPHFHKPHGLWVSVVGEDDWAAWVRQERDNQSALRYGYRVEVNPGADILWITTPQGIDDFHTAYSYQDELCARLGDDPFLPDRFVRAQWPIDWPKVTARHDGLVIAPYQWSRRMHGPHWYYSWDCASGCIWNTAAVVCLEEC